MAKPPAPIGHTPSVVYAFEWCDCVYESGFAVVSLHKDKRNAWRVRELKVAA